MIESSRRTFLVRCGALIAAGAAGADARAQDGGAELVYVGTQNRQICALRFDAASGALTARQAVTEGPRSTWLLAHPRLPVLYAVDDDSTREGRVIAYAVDRATGALAAIGEAPSGGKGTTYLWLDAPSMTLLAANFASGSVSSIALGADGRPGPLVSTRGETGSGPHRRQASAHAHSAAVDPSGRFVLVPDLGADRVFVYRFDRTTRALAPDDANRPHAFATTPGSGPRHLAFGADGRFVYLLEELTAQVLVLRWDAQQGQLAPVQSLSTDSADFKGVSSGAEIAVDIEGRHVYVANRGENTLLVYRIDRASGALALVQRQPAGGDTPWSFALHASGRWMLVANQRSGSIDVFAIDPASGLLAPTGTTVAVPAPVSLAFVK